MQLRDLQHELEAKQHRNAEGDEADAENDIEVREILRKPRLQPAECKADGAEDHEDAERQRKADSLGTVERDDAAGLLILLSEEEAEVCR